MKTYYISNIWTHIKKYIFILVVVDNNSWRSSFNIRIWKTTVSDTYYICSINTSYNIVIFIILVIITIIVICLFFNPIKIHFYYFYLFTQLSLVVAILFSCCFCCCSHCFHPHLIFFHKYSLCPLLLCHIFDVCGLFNLFLIMLMSQVTLRIIRFLAF